MQIQNSSNESTEHVEKAIAIQSIRSQLYPLIGSSRIRWKDVDSRGAKATRQSASLTGQIVFIVTVRISRMRHRLRLPYEVLHVLYLIFNEGYTSSVGAELQRPELSGEAIRLTRAVHHLLPYDGEVAGLPALILLTDARAAWHEPDLTAS